MYRIEITPKIIKFANDYASELFADKNLPHKRGRKFIKPKEQNANDGLNKLKNDIICNSIFKAKAQKYIDKIWASYEELLIARELGGEKNFIYWKNEFEKILSQDELKTKVNYNGTESEFHEHLVNVMQYDEAKKYIYKYFVEMEIKSCVYCNFVPIERRCDGTVNYQLDHYWCKSRYPYLCTSFFNLFPCCGSCNIIKSYEDYQDFFNLYCEDFEISSSEAIQDPFRFCVPNAVLEYYKVKNCNAAKIYFRARKKYAPQYLRNSKVEDLYNGENHNAKERLEDILYKIETNTKTQITVTSRTFPKLHLA